jgi:hypothetical protein
MPSLRWVGPRCEPVRPSPRQRHGSPGSPEQLRDPSPLPPAKAGLRGFRSQLPRVAIQHDLDRRNHALARKESRVSQSIVVRFPAREPFERDLWPPVAGPAATRAISRRRSTRILRRWSDSPRPRPAAIVGAAAPRAGRPVPDSERIPPAADAAATAPRVADRTSGRFQCWRRFVPSNPRPPAW